MPQYFLTQHMYVCHTPTGAILLDLRRDKYIGFNQEQSQALSRVVSGWLQPDAGTAGAAVSQADVDSFVESLKNSGILTTDTRSGKSAAACCLPLSDIQQLPEQPFRAGAPHLAAFLLAFTRAQVGLRWRSMLYAVESCRKRKLALRNAADASPERTAQVTGAFSHLRPYFFTDSAQCLFDSIALMEFLMINGICADLVIGVTADPFSAHAWVQAGRYVLNGSADYARRFRPILCI